MIITTPTLDKYPRAKQASVDVHALTNTPFGKSLTFHEGMSEILDSCLRTTKARKEEMIITNLLLYVPAKIYDSATLGQISDTYGEKIATVMADYATASDIDAFAAQFAPMAYFNKALDIFEHENLPVINTRDIADLERKGALAEVLGARSKDKTTATLYQRENTAITKLVAALRALTPGIETSRGIPLAAPHQVYFMR